MNRSWPCWAATSDVQVKVEHIVLLSPLRAPRLVEPLVVRRHEVHPLDDREVALEPAALVLHWPGEGERCAGACRTHRDRARAGLLQQIASAEAAFLRRLVMPFCHAPSFLSL